jgi:hypothetical protein
MYARNDFNSPFYSNPNARFVLAAVQARFVARVDLFVARWLERRAADAEAAQRWFDRSVATSARDRPG